MKTNQFIKEVESVGFKIKKIKDYMFVIDILGFHVAKTSMKEFGLISTNDSEFIKLDYNAKLQLLNLLIEYAKTPIEDRGEEEKYYYKLKGLDERRVFLKKFKHSNYITLSTYFDVKHEQYSLTDKEFEALPEDIKAHNWEKIKVESEEDENKGAH